MKLFPTIAAVILGASGMAIQPAAAQYFNPEDPNSVQQMFDAFDRAEREMYQSPAGQMLIEMNRRGMRSNSGTTRACGGNVYSAPNCY